MGYFLRSVSETPLNASPALLTSTARSFLKLLAPATPFLPPVGNIFATVTVEEAIFTCAQKFGIYRAVIALAEVATQNSEKNTASSIKSVQLNRPIGQWGVVTKKSIAKPPEYFPEIGEKAKRT